MKNISPPLRPLFTLSLFGSLLSASGIARFLRIALLALVPVLASCGGEGEVGYLNDVNGRETLPPSASCEVGAVVSCSVTLEQKSGVLSCYHGTRTCVAKDEWGPCENGSVTKQVDATAYDKSGQRVSEAPSGRDALALTTPIDCINNPCNLSCQFWAEDPVDISTMGTPGMDPGPLDDWSTTALCAHELCDVDTPALPRSCHPCVATVCDSDPSLAHCCDGATSTSWSEDCVNAVYTLCSATPPPQVPEICGFSVLADQTMNLNNATNYPGAVGAHNGVILSSMVTAGALISSANLNLTNASSFGLVYTTGSVTTGSGLSVAQIVAEGDVTIGNSATVGVNGIFTHGNFLSPSSGWTVQGPVTALGDCSISNSSRIDGDVNCGGSFTINSSTFTTGANVYVGGNVTIQNQNKPAVNMHIGGDLIFSVGDSRVGGNVWLGGNVGFNAADNRITGTLHAGGNGNCGHSTGTGVIGNAYFGGTVTSPGTCANWGGGSPNVMQASPPLVAPTPPAIAPFPSPPTPLPTVDAYRRDTTAVCATAAAAADLTGSSRALYPGIYGDIDVPNASTMTLLAPGSYVFNSYRSGSGVPFRMAGGGPWDITVCTEFALKNGAQMIDTSTNAQVAANLVTIYSAEVSGGCAPNGSDNCCIYSESSTKLSGMLIAPDCDISVGNGTDAKVLVWANNVFTGSGVSLPPTVEDCNDANLMGQITCGSVALYMDGIAYANGAQVTYGGKRYVCTNAANCSAGGWANYWPGQGTNWASAWNEFDDCPDIVIPTMPIAPEICPVLVGSPSVLDYDVEDCVSSADCQVNSSCTEAFTAASCSHSKCVAGAPLSNPACRRDDWCVNAICELQPSCCSAAGFWDQTLCADKVEKVCSVTCGALTPSVCTHDACVVGAGLDESCSAAVEAVCDAPGFSGCCGGGAMDWNASCVDQYTLAATGSPPTPPSPVVGNSLCDYALTNGSGAANMNGSRVYGSVFANGAINGSGLLDGNAKVTSAFVIGHTNVTGTKDNSLTMAPYTLPTWAQVLPSPGPGCGSVTTASDLWAPWTTAPTKGNSYGNVTVENNFTLPSGGHGDYYVNSFRVSGSSTLNLPADGSTVNIYVCGGIFEVANQANIVSPTNSPTQLNVWVNGSEIKFLGVGHATYESDGVFSIVGGAGTVNLQGRTTINGMVHNISGGFNLENDAVVNAAGVNRNACLSRGIDPSVPPPNPCPTGTTPAQSAAVSEGGVCVSNMDASDNLIPRPAGHCPDVDLTADAPCDDQIPVCNRGDSALLAGQAEIVFFPRQTAQFATPIPNAFWQDPAVCTINVPIAAGTCEVITGCPVYMEDMTAQVRMKSSATQSECNDLDNWTYYPFDRMCGSSMTGDSEKTVIEVYEAECPNNSTVAWGYLGWNTVLAGAATVTFEARLSSDGTFSGGRTLLGTAAAATSTQICPLIGCGANVGDTFYPGGETNQSKFLELTMTLEADGTNNATLADWKLSYTCVIDQ